MSEHFGHVRITVLTSRSTLTFMMSQPGLQTIAIYILPHISQSKGNQALTFGQVIEYNIRNIFPDLFSFFEKAFYEVKASGLQFSFNHFR